MTKATKVITYKLPRLQRTQTNEAPGSMIEVYVIEADAKRGPNCAGESRLVMLDKMARGFLSQSCMHDTTETASNLLFDAHVLALKTAWTHSQGAFE